MRQGHRAKVPRAVADLLANKNVVILQEHVLEHYSGATCHKDMGEHYHCTNCLEIVSALGHYRKGGFTCRKKRA